MATVLQLADFTEPALNIFFVRYSADYSVRNVSIILRLGLCVSKSASTWSTVA